MLSRLAVAVSAFVTTDVDDLFLLAGLFSSASFRPRSIVVGQFLGIGALTAASIVAALAAIALPERWVALLGLVPLVLGLRRLADLIRERRAETTGGEGVAGLEPTGARWQSLQVAAVTIANGGDNLGVYVPLFASDLDAIPLYVAGFALMTGVWCLLGWWLVNNPWLGPPLRRYGRIVLPFVLIALGLYILLGRQ